MLTWLERTEPVIEAGIAVVRQDYRPAITCSVGRP